MLQPIIAIVTIQDASLQLHIQGFEVNEIYHLKYGLERFASFTKEKLIDHKAYLRFKYYVNLEIVQYNKENLR